MRALKYVFVFVLLIVLFCVALAPKENGFLLRKNYLGFVSRINQQQATFHIDILNYKLHWFTSDVKLHITRKNAQSNDSGFFIDQHIWHGPYLHDPMHGWMHLYVMVKTNAKMDDQLAAYFKLQKPLTFHLLTKVSFQNEVSTQYEIDPVMVASTDVKLAIQKTHGIIIIRPKQPIQYDINFKDASLAAQNIQINMTDFSLQHEESCQNSHCIVTKKFAIPNMTIATKQTSLGVTGTYLLYSSSTNAENKNNYKIDLNLAKIIDTQNQYGPFVLHLGINNLDGMELRKLNANHPGQSAVAQTFFSRLITNLPQLFTKDLTMTGDAQLTLPGGDVVMHAKLLWPVTVPLPQDLLAVEQHVDTNVSLHIDAGVVNQILPKIAEYLDEMITARRAESTHSVSTASTRSNLLIILQKQWDDLMKQGYFMRDNTGYATTFTNDNGSIKANGKILNFSMLMQANRVTPKPAQKSASKAP